MKSTYLRRYYHHWKKMITVYHLGKYFGGTWVFPPVAMHLLGTDLIYIIYIWFLFLVYLGDYGVCLTITIVIIITVIIGWLYQLYGSKLKSFFDLFQLIYTILWLYPIGWKLFYNTPPLTSTSRSPPKNVPDINFFYTIQHIDVKHLWLIIIIKWNMNGLQLTIFWTVLATLQI